MTVIHGHAPFDDVVAENYKVLARLPFSKAILNTHHININFLTE
jgi:hypothetical protein